MEAKTVADTQLTMGMHMTPADANPMGHVQGGVILKHIDTAAGVVAIRHAGRQAVTASIDRVEFFNPVFVGDVLMLRCSLNMVGATSMEVGVRVEAENPVTGEVKHTASAYLTVVALDRNGRPTPVPGVIPESEDELRRERQAKERRKMRLAAKAREKEMIDSEKK